MPTSVRTIQTTINPFARCHEPWTEALSLLDTLELATMSGTSLGWRETIWAIHAIVNGKVLCGATTKGNERDSGITRWKTRRYEAGEVTCESCKTVIRGLADELKPATD